MDLIKGKRAHNSITSAFFFCNQLCLGVESAMQRRWRVETSGEVDERQRGWAEYARGGVEGDEMELLWRRRSKCRHSKKQQRKWWRKEGVERYWLKLNWNKNCGITRVSISVEPETRESSHNVGPLRNNLCMLLLSSHTTAYILEPIVLTKLEFYWPQKSEFQFSQKTSQRFKLYETFA